MYIPDNIIQCVGLFRVDVFVVSCIDSAASTRQMARGKSSIAYQERMPTTSGLAVVNVMKIDRPGRSCYCVKATM